MRRHTRDDTGRDPASVGATVQREIGPSVRVLAARGGRKVRRVAHDALDGPHAVGEVRSYGEDRQVLASGDGGEGDERLAIQVRRDDAHPRAGRRDRERAVPRPDVEKPRPHGTRREREQERGVLARRVDRGARGDRAVRASH